MAGGIKVSIIVPVYNVPEKALRKCLESAINQTMHEIEILVVDDGSTDNSGRICDQYAEKDSRLSVIHKTNAGLSSARNAGYEAAKGEWITFLDGDDWIEANTCKDNYEFGISSGADIVIFGTIQEFYNYNKPFKYNLQEGRVYRGEECKRLQREILNFNGNIATAWAKLIRKKVLDDNHIKHSSELRQGSEGIEFNIRLFGIVDSVTFNNSIFYHYIYNPNSISAKHDEKNHHYVIKCFEKIKEEIMCENNSDLLSMLYTRFSYVIISAAITGYFSPRNKDNYRKKREAYKRYLNDAFVVEAINNINYENLDLKRKIVLYLIKNRIYFALLILSYIRYLQKR